MGFAPDPALLFADGAGEGSAVRGFFSGGHGSERQNTTGGRVPTYTPGQMASGKGLILVAGLGLAVFAARRRSSGGLAPNVPLPGTLDGSQAPHAPNPKPRPKPRPSPAPVAPQVPPPVPIVSPVGQPPPLAVELPAGWHYLKQTELTNELAQVAQDMLAKGIEPGTFNLFDLDGKRYAGVVWRDSLGNLTVTIATEN